MSQSGDGGLWPTADGDTSPSPGKDADTHQLPVPDQQEQPGKPASPAGGWFGSPEDAAAGADPAADDQKGDEPHAKPGQQITRPVPWPVADLERQVPPGKKSGKKSGEKSGEDEERPPRDEDPATVFSRPLPRQSGEATAFVQRPAPGAPAWPATEKGPAAEQKSTPPGPTESAPPSFTKPGDGAARPRQENPATSFAQPIRKPGGPSQDSAPGATRSGGKDDSPSGQDNEATAFIHRDTLKGPAPSRPDKPGRPPENPAAFTRRDNPPSFTRAGGVDSATVNLAIPDPGRRDEWPPPEPPRAAPQRVGTPPPESGEPEPEPKRGTRKPLLIAVISIAAVIALAAGVVFGVPGVSDKLGLTGEDPVAIDPPPAPVTYRPALHGPDTDTPGPTPQGVEQVLAGPVGDPALGNINGIVIDPATGETLYEKNAGAPITPASTGKILTAAAALLSLDPTEQLVTKVVEGERPGEVIIVGGGDPTISSLAVGEESIYPGAPHLSELVDQVRASGVPVETVHIDQSRYAEPGLAPSWLPADIGLGYIAPIVPAMLDGDRQGDATENYSPRTTDPGRTLVDEFAERIGAAPADSIEKEAPADAKVLGEIRSAPVTQLVDNMLNRSENTLGDVLAHEVAVKAGEEPSFDGASKAMLDVLRKNGFDVEGAVVRDGSGMSEENRMPARLLADVLAVAASPDGKDPRTAKLRPLLGGLPVAGGSGTLADRYTEAGAVEGKGWVRAKTGSLTGINSLAGIVLDKDNRPLVFAFLTSGTVATSARPALDGVTAALRGCGCQ